MILSDKRILEEIGKGTIKIEPYNRDQLGSNSYDVHLSKNLARYINKELDAKKHNEIEHFEIPDEGFGDGAVGLVTVDDNDLQKVLFGVGVETAVRGETVGDRHDKTASGTALDQERGRRHVLHADRKRIVRCGGQYGCCRRHACFRGVLAGARGRPGAGGRLPAAPCGIPPRSDCSRRCFRSRGVRQRRRRSADFAMLFRRQRRHGRLPCGAIQTSMTVGPAHRRPPDKPCRCRH